MVIELFNVEKPKSMSRYEILLRRLNEGAQIMIDGGTGTEVERRGVPQLENAWNGGAALSHPDVVRKIHEDYINNGSEIIISNTFATSLNLLEDAGVPELFADYNRRGIELACEARTRTGIDNVLVAGGISHWSFSGRLPSLDDLRNGAAKQAEIMARAGADLIMLEMMIEIPRMLAVFDGASSCGLPIWVGLSCAPDADRNICLQAGKTDSSGAVYGESTQSLIDAIAVLNGTNIPLLNIMHTDVKYINDCLDIVESQWGGFVGVYAHSGKYIDGDWVFDGTITPDEYSRASRGWLDRNVQIIGGCCGIRPDHIAKLADLEYR